VPQLEDIVDMSKEELEEVATQCNMKPGHKKRFLGAFKDRGSSSGNQPSARESNVKVVVEHVPGAINDPGVWPFMISYTQRGSDGEKMAIKIWNAFEKKGMKGWLDKQMAVCDEAAMKEAVLNSGVVFALVTGDEKKDLRYFQRGACIKELEWAIEARKHIVPINPVKEKDFIGKFIGEGKAKGIDLSGCNFICKTAPLLLPYCPHPRTAPVDGPLG
jgi:hypothetical protein